MQMRQLSRLPSEWRATARKSFLKPNKSKKICPSWSILVGSHPPFIIDATPEHGCVLKDYQKLFYQHEMHIIDMKEWYQNPVVSSHKSGVKESATGIQEYAISLSKLVGPKSYLEKTTMASASKQEKIISKCVRVYLP